MCGFIEPRQMKPLQKHLEERIPRMGTPLVVVTSNQMSQITLRAWCFQLEILAGTTGAGSDGPVGEIISFAPGDASPTGSMWQLAAHPGG